MNFNIQYAVADITEEVNDILNAKFVRLDSAFHDMDLALRSNNLILFGEKLEVVRARVREFDLRLRDSEQIIKGYMEHMLGGTQGEAHITQESVGETTEGTAGGNDDNKTS